MIFNASEKKLDEIVGTLPTMTDSLRDWFQQLTFVRLTKTVENFKVLEKEIEVKLQGVIQSMQAEKLSMKPEGQRSWKWFTLHTEPHVVFKTDEIVEHRGARYRIMTKQDFAQYGYLEYELVQDYEGAQP